LAGLRDWKNRQLKKWSNKLCQRIQKSNQDLQNLRIDRIKKKNWREITYAAKFKNPENPHQDLQNSRIYRIKKK